MTDELTVDRCSVDNRVLLPYRHTRHCDGRLTNSLTYCISSTRQLTGHGRSLSRGQTRASTATAMHGARRHNILNDANQSPRPLLKSLCVASSFDGWQCMEQPTSKLLRLNAIDFSCAIRWGFNVRLNVVVITRPSLRDRIKCCTQSVYPSVRLSIRPVRSI